MTIELGPADRKVSADIAVSAIPPLRHDFLAIAEANRFIPFHQKPDLRNIIEGLLHESNFFPIEVDDYLLGIVMFGFADLVIRDTVVGTTFELDEDEDNLNSVVSFVPHDAAINMRQTSFGLKCGCYTLSFLMIIRLHIIFISLWTNLVSLSLGIILEEIGGSCLLRLESFICA